MEDAISVLMKLEMFGSGFKNIHTYMKAPPGPIFGVGPTSCTQEPKNGKLKNRTNSGVGMRVMVAPCPCGPGFGRFPLEYV